MDEKEIETTTNSESFMVSENYKEAKSPPSVYNGDEKWVQEYIEQFGTEPSFF